jgi:leucyl aminopeptidase
LNLDELRLVQFSPDGEPEWVTEREKLQAKAMGRDYMDMYAGIVVQMSSLKILNCFYSTDTPFLGTVSEKPVFSYPRPNSTIVAEILPLLATAELKANLEHLTGYHTRYYNSDTGKAASDWLYAKILAYTAELASEAQKPLISVEALKHPWKQNSIVSESWWCFGAKTKQIEFRARLSV